MDGGWGAEAIEIEFFHATREKDLSQIILIGDAPPNTFEEVKYKRNKDWNSSVLYKTPSF